MKTFISCSLAQCVGAFTAPSGLRNMIKTGYVPPPKEVPNYQAIGVTDMPMGESKGKIPYWQARVGMYFQQINDYMALFGELRNAFQNFVSSPATPEMTRETLIRNSDIVSRDQAIMQEVADEVVERGDLKELPVDDVKQYAIQLETYVNKLKLHVETVAGIVQGQNPVIEPIALGLPGKMPKKLPPNLQEYVDLFPPGLSDKLEVPATTEGQQASALTNNNNNNNNNNIVQNKQMNQQELGQMPPLGSILGGGQPAAQPAKDSSFIVDRQSAEMALGNAFPGIQQQMSRFESLKEPFVQLIQRGHPQANMLLQESDDLDKDHHLVQEQAEKIGRNGDIAAMSDGALKVFATEVNDFYKRLSQFVEKIGDAIAGKDVATSKKTKKSKNSKNSKLGQWFGEDAGEEPPQQQAPQEQLVQKQQQQEAPKNPYSKGIKLPKLENATSSSTSGTTSSPSENKKKTAEFQRPNLKQIDTGKMNKTSSAGGAGSTMPAATQDLISKLQGRGSPAPHINMTPGDWAPEDTTYGKWMENAGVDRKEFAKQYMGQAEPAQQQQQQQIVQQQEQQQRAPEYVPELKPLGGNNMMQMKMNNGQEQQQLLADAGDGLTLMGEKIELDSSAASFQQEMLQKYLPGAQVNTEGSDAWFPQAKNKLAQLPNEMTTSPVEQSAGMNAFAAGGALYKDPELLRVEKLMGQFESQIVPLFSRRDAQTPSLPLTADDERILGGQESMKLHERFMGIQEKLSTVSQMTAEQQTELKAFNDDLEQHIEQALRTFSKIGLASAPGPAAASRFASGTKEQKLESAFMAIQSGMQAFEMRVAARFSQLTEEQQRSAQNAEEQALLSGSVSQEAHERFVQLQQRGMQAQSGALSEGAFDMLIADLKTYETFLKNHVAQMAKLLDRVTGVVNAGGVMMSETIAVSNPGSGTQHLKASEAAEYKLAQKPNVGSSGGNGLIFDEPTLGSMPASPPGAGRSTMEAPTLGPMGGGGGKKTMGTPSGFGGAKAAATNPNATPEQKELEANLETIQKNMDHFQNDVSPQISKMQTVRHLMKEKLSEEDYILMTGSSTDTLNSRWRMLAQTLQGNISSQMVPRILEDVRSFNRDLADHIKFAKEVIPRAAKIYSSSGDGYKKETKNLSTSQIKTEIGVMEQELAETIPRLPKMIASMKERMKLELPKLADPAVVDREGDKLAHMMSTLSSSAETQVERIKEALLNNESEEVLNDIFYDDLLLDFQRFAATVQDLDKEEAKAQLSSNPTEGLARKVGATKDAKIGSVLGTRGVTKQNIQGKSGNVEKSITKARTGAENVPSARTNGGLVDNNVNNVVKQASQPRANLGGLPKLNVDEL